MKWIFIHSWHLFHSKSSQILLHSIWRILHSYLISLSGDLECDFIQLWQMFHSMFHSSWPPFQWQLHSLMAIASFSVSFHHGSSFMQYFIPSGIHFNRIFISSWQLLHSPLDFVSSPPGSYFMQYFIPSGMYFIETFISSWYLLHFSFRFWLIPPWQLFHAIFHSIWQVFHWNFHFFMAATSFFLRILSHSPLAAISCNISFLLACISLKFSFLHGR